MEESTGIMAATAPRPDDAPAASLSDEPRAGQTVLHQNTLFTTIREGRAHILAPTGTSKQLLESDAKTAASKGPISGADVQAVFYNPIQQFNRDLSVLAARAFGPDLLARRRKAAAKAAQAAQAARERRVKRSKRKRSDDGSDGANDAGSVAAVVDPESTDEADKLEPDNGSAFQPAFTILDALSATGLRALRYSLEVPFATDVTANDLSPTATAAIRLNAAHNRVAGQVRAMTGNAMSTMYARLDCVDPRHSTPRPIDKSDPKSAMPDPDSRPTRFDLIDLDPYGSAAPFIDAAVQAVSDGGMLAITCTDSSVFASAGYPEKTFSLYGGLPTKGPYSHETALRLIVHTVAQSAGRYGIAVEPLLSLSIDYYVRIFIRLRRSPADVKFLAGKTMVVYACDAGCGAWVPQPIGRNSSVESRKKVGSRYFKHSSSQGPLADSRCAHCGFKTHLAGPMWAGPLHNAAFVDRMLSMVNEVRAESVDGDESTDSSPVYATLDRVEGMLLNVRDELAVLPSECLPLSSTPTAERTCRTVDNPNIIPSVPIHALDPHPFYFSPSSLSRVIRTQSPSEALFRGALRHAGFIATRSHVKPGMIKTNASWFDIWTIMRAWVIDGDGNIKEGRLNQAMAGWTIMKLGIDVQSKSEPMETTDVKMDMDEPVKDGDASMIDTDLDPSSNPTVEISENTDPSIPTDETPRTSTPTLSHPKWYSGSKPPGSSFKVVFDAVLGKDAGSKRDDQKSSLLDPESKSGETTISSRKVPRYQLNPEPNWGPIRRARAK